MKEISGGITAPAGFKASGIHCGIKTRRKDLALIYSERETVAQAVFTTNKIQSASVKLSRENLQDAKARAIVINSGCANTCTGVRGYEDARVITALVARELGLKKQDVLVASTGIIGQFLPMNKIKSRIKYLAKSLNCGGNTSAARAIMTTDTFHKEKAVRIKVSGKEVRIGAMGKGAGMIYPSMATMLCFITTNASISKSALEKALRDSVDKSFHRITVDGDRSTNDSVFILANGIAGNRKMQSGTESFDEFRKALSYITCEISKMIVKDAEGAKKFIEIKVAGARIEEDAKKIGFSIANSPLVKTALGAGSSNWGRIASAIGSAGVNIAEGKLSIFVGDVQVMKNGCLIDCDVRKVKKLLAGCAIKISIHLNLGQKDCTVWTSDLTEEYVRINK